MEPKETPIAVLAGKLSDPDSHARYSAALCLINPAEKGLDISVAMPGLVHLLNDPDAKCVFMSSQAIAAYAKAGGDISIALDQLWSIIQNRLHAPISNPLDAAARFAWKSHKYAAKNPATRGRVIARAEAALEHPDPFFVSDTALFIAHMARSEVDISSLEPALARVIAFEFPHLKDYESIKVNASCALANLQDNGGCLGVSIPPLVGLFVTRLKDQAHENAGIALKGAIKDERSRAAAVEAIVSSIQITSDTLWSCYLKPLLIYASGHGAPFDFAMIRRALKKKLEDAEKGDPFVLGRIQSEVVAGYMEFAEAAAMAKKPIFDGGERLEGVIRPPKMDAGSGYMFRVQAGRNPSADRPLASRSVKGVG